MGITKDQLGIAVGLVKEYVDKNAASNAENISYDNSASKLQSTNIQSAIDEVNTKTNSLDKISYAQKTVNTDLSWGSFGLTSAVDVSNNSPLKLNKVFDGNMELGDNGGIKLKANTAYNIQVNAYNAAVNGGLFLYDCTNSKIITEISGDTSAGNNAICAASWNYKPTVNIEVSAITTNSYTFQPTWDTINVQEIGRVTTIDPLNYVDGTSGIEDMPVGHVIDFMCNGDSIPKHYLQCNGALYNISDYPFLSEYFKTQFKSYNYFGGDGETTFAVPSRQSTDAYSIDGQIIPVMTSNTLPSGSIEYSSTFVIYDSMTLLGTENSYKIFTDQPSTSNYNFHYSAENQSGGYVQYNFENARNVVKVEFEVGTYTASNNQDYEVYLIINGELVLVGSGYATGTELNARNKCTIELDKVYENVTGVRFTTFVKTTKVTNQNIFLYSLQAYSGEKTIKCIKYEPTYYMNVNIMSEKTVLFDGIMSAKGNYKLNDDIKNYDSLYIEADLYTQESNKNRSVITILTDFINYDATANDYFMSAVSCGSTGFNFDSDSSINIYYINACRGITKVVGIKNYKDYSSYKNTELLEGES